MIPYGSQNDLGQWWDGRAWRNDTADKHWLLAERYAMDDAFNRHADGCFICPRCRMPHFLPDTYDCLCDGCQDILLTHPQATQDMRDGILEWKSMARLHWRGQPQAPITARIAERQRLVDGR